MSWQDFFKKKYFLGRVVTMNKLSNHYGFNMYNYWHCKFPIDKLSIDRYGEVMISEPRIDQLIKRLSLKDMRVLELGCLEGMHSFIMHNLGAREITAIEGRKDNFLKCLIVKNAFQLDKCRFLLGDLNEILASVSGVFDLCLALGIIYHLTSPVEAIYKLAELSNKLFVWTHYATKSYPQGVLVDIKYKGCIYRGKYVGEDTSHYLSGLNRHSFWIFEEDILKVIKDAGFKSIELITKEEHEHGPAMTFLASK